MLTFSSIISAQTINNPALGGLGSLSGSQFFSRLIPALISFGFVLGVIMFVLYLMLGAIQWITSGSDKAQNQEAKNKIMNALIGIVILFAFFAILNLVECFFGIGLRQVEVGAFNIRFLGNPFCPAP